MPVPSESKMRAAIDWQNCSDEWLAWKHIKPITREHLIKGTGIIELLPAGTKIGQEPNEEKGPLVPLGKYKGKTIEWLKENDEQYYEWAKENVAVFSKL